MPKEKLMIVGFLFILIVAISCSSNKPTGKTVSVEETIYEEINQTEQQAEPQIEPQVAMQINETEVNDTEEEPKEQKAEIIINETLLIDNLTNEKTEEFKFQPTSIVNTQHNISLSLDDFKHEIKDGYWGKIIEITMTVLNKGNKAFKPKVLVLLYDEKDFKEEWLKPKAEIQFDEQLNVGEHVTRYAIVNIAFDDINLTKNFKLVLVDAADLGNKPVVVVETEFKPT